MKVIHKAVYAGFYGVLLFLVSLTLSWAFMLKFDFFYGVWHDHGGIKEGIEKYGPRNRYKPGFADTTRDQRVDLFHEINIAVHNGGDGLESIQYQSPTSNGKQNLLRQPEIIHLQDVAKLIDLLMIVMAIVLAAWPGAAVFFYKREGYLPKFVFQLCGLGGVLGTLGLVLLIFGAENVFNTLHIWIFPKDHPWFFYYQDSLMSTMMLAPVLFAWIAAAWIAISIAVFLLLNLILAFGVRFKETH